MDVLRWDTRSLPTIRGLGLRAEDCATERAAPINHSPVGESPPARGGSDERGEACRLDLERSTGKPCELDDQLCA